MGNINPRTSSSILTDSVDGAYIQTNQELLYQSQSTISFGSVISHQSTCSVSRPWSRVSRRRWKESTLTLPYESSKTAWPVTQSESVFLPEFPFLSHNEDKKFVNLGEISKGSFGKVYKVKRNQSSDEFFALKVLSKAKIINESAVRQVKEEVQIQRVCGHHPFIVNCPLHWQSKKRLYIVSDYVPGGELYTLLKSYTVLHIELIRLYIAQLVLILDFLHNAGVIYRDLKPENILLDTDGNLQLIDFGLSKWLPYGKRTRTICGTRLYMAPEILDCHEYGHNVDWWSLGIIACLMLTNKYPQIELDVVENEKTVILPQNDRLVDVPTRDLVLRLLQIDPGKRMKSMRTAQTIAFFKGYDFEDVKQKKIKPNDLLNLHHPNGPDPPLETSDFDDFSGDFMITSL